MLPREIWRRLFKQRTPAAFSLAPLWVGVASSKITPITATATSSSSNVKARLRWNTGAGFTRKQ
jgi:hypothetical protein